MSHHYQKINNMIEPNTMQNNSKPNDEIDIFEFCSRIWMVFVRFLTGIKNLIVSIIIYLIRKSLWIISFGVAGLLIGYLLHSVSRPHYSSLLEADTRGVSNFVVIDHINKLSLIDQKPALLASYLGIDFAQAASVRSIKAAYGIDINRDGIPDYIDFKNTYNPKDTMQRRVSSLLYIEVSVYDESILPVLRNGLLQYINNNVYVQELFRIDREQKKQLVKEIELEIAKIDSLQKVQFRKELVPDKGQTVIFGNMPEPRLFYNEILLLFEKKQRLEKELDMSKEIILILHDFTPLQQEERPLLFFMLVYGILMAVAGIFFALLRQYRQTIWKLIREDSTNM